MFRFLFYSILLILLITSIYLFTPNTGLIEIKTDYFYINMTLNAFLVVILISILLFSILLHVLFLLFSIPNKLKNLHQNYIKNKVQNKIFDLLCIIESDNAEKINKFYNPELLKTIDHPISDLIRLKFAYSQKNKSLQEESLSSLRNTKLTKDFVIRPKK